MMTLIKYIKAVFLVVLALMMNACVWVEDPDDLRQFVQQVRQAEAPPIKPLPEFKPYHSFVYEGASLRDPFQSLAQLSDSNEVAVDVVQDNENGLRPDSERPKSYLEEFALDSLKMVGTIGMSKQRWALIRDDKGEVHRVTSGDYMGLDFGQVVTVSNGFIELKEIVPNGRGGWMTRQRSIVMDDE